MIFFAIQRIASCIFRNESGCRGCRRGNAPEELYGKDGNIEGVVMLADYMVTDKGYYSCDRDYCDVLIRLCEEKEGGMIED